MTTFGCKTTQPVLAPDSVKPSRRNFRGKARVECCTACPVDPVRDVAEAIVVGGGQAEV